MEEDDAALVFASGSHRDFSLPYWHTLEGILKYPNTNQIGTFVLTNH